MNRVLILIIYLITIIHKCEPDFNYREEGVASYYSDFLEGRKTASGEIYYRDSLTAAHKTLPLGSKVLITNLKNEKSIWVVINDRGPFIKNRIIDLSRRAADSLDIIRPGIAPVKIETHIEKDDVN